METNEALALILSKLDNLEQDVSSLKQDVSELKQGQERLEQKVDDGFALAKNHTAAIIEAINVTNDSVTKVDKKVDVLQKRTDLNTIDIANIRAAM